jgi:hypothetical protein
MNGISQDCIGALSCYDETFAEGSFDLPHHITEIYSPTMQPRDLAIIQTIIRGQQANTRYPSTSRSSLQLSNSNTVKETMIFKQFVVLKS